MATMTVSQQVEIDEVWKRYKEDPTNKEYRNLLVENYLPLVKYNGERIWARLPEGVELVIEDRGPGILPDIQDRVFHPFVTGRAGGVGLGLALAQRIVVLHGGRIRLENRDGGGARALLWFPLRGPAGGEGALQSPEDQRGGGGVSSAG